MELILYVEEHRGLGGNIISRLNNGAFVGLIYSLLVFSWFHVDVVPSVITVPFTNFWSNVTLVGKEKYGTTIVLLDQFLVQVHMTRRSVAPLGTGCLGITTLHLPFTGSK